MYFHTSCWGRPRNKLKFTLKFQETRNVLDCANYRWFWLSWGKGRIEIGAGSRVGDMVMLHWIDDQSRLSDVQAIAVSTAMNVRGAWQFARIPGNFNLLYYAQVT